jgi:hypothetical protein
MLMVAQVKTKFSDIVHRLSQADIMFASRQTRTSTKPLLFSPLTLLTVCLSSRNNLWCRGSHSVSGSHRDG